MILINSRFRYYHTLLGVEIERDKVYGGHGELKPFVLKNKNSIYYRIDGKATSINKLLNTRYLVAIIEDMSLPDWAR